MKNLFTSKMVFKMASCVASLSFIIAASSSSAMCFYFAHQPKMPEKVRQLKR